MSIPGERDDGFDSGPQDDLLAGEYALGVLDAARRHAVEERIPGDAAFARLVADWEARLSPLLAEGEPVLPSPDVWRRIRTRIGMPSVQVGRPGLWNNPGFWRGATGLALAAGLAMVAIGLRTPQPAVQVGETAARPVVVLAHDDGVAGWLATIDVARRRIEMVPVPSSLPAPELANELWLIAPGQAPRSLGKVSSDRAHAVEVPAALQHDLVPGALLAITVESASGIPHAAPSGAIVAKGQITSL